MSPLVVVLAFPFIVMAGYASAWVLSGRDVHTLTGRAGLLLYASLLAVPLLAVLAARTELPFAPVPAWTIGGALSGGALWWLQEALPGRRPDASGSVWTGAPGWGGFMRLMVVVTSIVVAEEVVWRGYLLVRIGLVLSSLAFAAHHYFFGLRHVLFSFLAGLAWGGLFLASGSLVPPIVSHLVYNALAWRHMRKRARPPGGCGKVSPP